MKPLRVLILEDSEDDAELILRALRKGGYEPIHRRTETAEGMAAALEEAAWDIVISDHSMPRFNAMAGLELLREKGIDIPFIVVSGTIGEETAVEAMAAGAGDFVMKDSMGRLVPAIERELREAATRATRRAAERALVEGEARLRAVMDNVIDGILTVDAGGTIESVNPAAERLFGFEPGGMVGVALPTLLAEQHREEYEEHFADYGRTTSMEILGLPREVQANHRDGSSLPIDLALSEMELDSDRRLIAVARDISERKKAESQLRHLAEHDALTGLVNRRRFEEEVSRHMAYGARYGAGGTVLVLDLDNFKYVNDTLGHKAGDELIRRVARVVEDRVRDADTLARLGGDEFAILLRGPGEEGARVAAENLLEAIRREPFLLGGQRVRVTTSVGLAPLDPDAATAGEVLARADQAMYQAKSAGRDRFAEYSPAGRAEIEASRTWSERVRQALEQDMFDLYCQPILDLRTDSIAQYELLLRMKDGDGGLTLPGAFLATAERFSLIQPIDRWVVREAIKLLDAHRREGRDLLIEVNLSGASMDDPELPALVERRLEATGIEPSRLIFEVTETMAIANLDKARTLAERLVSIGCRFALDDFGVGFASFYYLKHLPIAYLKIDGDFIRGLTHSRTDQLVVKALVEISHGLGIKTIAECVEDRETLEALRHYGVDYAQGFWIERPVPRHELPLRGLRMAG